MRDEAAHPEEGAIPKRGEAAWKQAREDVAERNRRARVAGKERREAYEREREAARQERERRQMADMRAKHAADRRGA